MATVPMNFLPIAGLATSFRLLGAACEKAEAAMKAASDSVDRIEHEWLHGLAEDELSSYFSFRAAGVPMFEAMAIIDSRRTTS